MIVRSKQLIARIARQTGLTTAEVRVIYHFIIDEVQAELIKGNTVIIQEFGRFRVSTFIANPPLEVRKSRSRRRVSFMSSPKFRSRLNHEC